MVKILEVLGGPSPLEQIVPGASLRLNAMRTGLSAGTLAVLIMWAPEARPSPGSSSCKDKEIAIVTLPNIIL